MKTSKAALVALLGGTLTLAANTTMAQQQPSFVFHVPVGLRNIHPAAKGLMVHCHVLKNRGTRTRENEVATSFGAGRQYATISVDQKGYFNDVVKVNAYTSPGQNAADGKYYVCDLWMDGHAIESSRSKGPQFESKAGTQRRVQITGEIR
jgi:hypothetical protein